MNKKVLLLLWAVVLLSIYSTAGWKISRSLADTKNVAAARHAARLDPVRAEPGKTPPDPLPDTGPFATVAIGTYIDRIVNLSIRESVWEADFYVWFRWKGDPKLDPGGLFQVIDGEISSKELLDDFHAPDGTNYQRYRVKAQMTKFFDVSRFPLEDHMLNIYIEDGSRDGMQLRYAVDSGASKISSRVKVPGFDLKGFGEVIKNHTYKSPYGDPRKPAEVKRIVSQYVMGIRLSRPGFDLYLKISLALFAALTLAFCVLFIKPTEVDPRFGLAAGAFFGAVANMYLSNAMVPDSGGFGLIDFVNGIGLGTIFLIVAESVISLGIHSKLDDPETSRRLDRVTAAILIPCYVIINTVVACAAYLF